jgi:Flp pilus assembly protein TadD
MTPNGGLALLAIGAAILESAACAHKTTVSHDVRQTYSAPRATAIRQQIINAIDAGEGDPEVRELRRRIAVNPDDIKARLDLAARYDKQGFPELAIEHYRLAGNRAPHLSSVHMLLARSLYGAGARTEAIETLVTFCKRDSAPPAELLSLLGIYQDQAGEYVQAEAHHRAALAIAPKRESLHNNLGYNLLLQSRDAEAASEFRRALALNPRSETARNNLGTALAMMPGGNVNEALAQWQSIGGPAAAHNNLATIFIQQKRYAEARKEIEIALSYSRNHDAALANLALVSELDGGPATAKVPARRRFASHKTAPPAAVAKQ